jgi:hypothetical protein
MCHSSCGGLRWKHNCKCAVLQCCSTSRVLRSGCTVCTDAYGRQPPEREGWRERDRGGYAGRPHAPPASRSAAIASYAGRGGAGRRPDDPERVRRTVFVDNVETHYNEEVG